MIQSYMSRVQSSLCSVRNISELASSSGSDSSLRHHHFILVSVVLKIGQLNRFMAKIINSICVITPLCACFTTIFTTCVLVISLRLNLASGAYIAVVV
jgi:hypothetical protein